MKITLDLPNDLVKEVKLRAVHDERKLKDLMADLLRAGLAGAASGRALKPTSTALKQRKEIVRKFVSGEWGLELAGFEEGPEIDRRKTHRRAKAG